jgi:hypothetical protein
VVSIRKTKERREREKDENPCTDLVNGGRQIKRVREQETNTSSQTAVKFKRELGFWRWLILVDKNHRRNMDSVRSLTTTTTVLSKIWNCGHYFSDLWKIEPTIGNLQTDRKPQHS